MTGLLPRALARLPGLSIAVGVGTAAGLARLALTTAGVRSRAVRLVGDRPGRLGWASARRHGLGVLGPMVARWGRRLQWGIAGSEAEHAELLESVARSLRSGASLTVGLEQVAAALRGRAGTEMGQALRTVRGGASLPAAIDAWAAGSDPARTLAGAALALGAELGGARARALDDAASGLRDRAALQREIRALTAQTRASAAVMVLAPLAFALVSWRADAGVARVLASPAGLACLVCGLALDAAGACWMATLARSVS
jgi:Flp pilus assembly protein TadB